MNVDKGDVNFEELARCCDDFNGAQVARLPFLTALFPSLISIPYLGPVCKLFFLSVKVKAICVEAGMLALRREASIIKHEDFMEAIAVVAAKKKGSLDYYS